MVHTDSNLTGAAAAFLLGVLICFGNYIISGYFLKKHKEKYHFVSFIRQPIQILYIVAAFFLAPYTPWDRTYLLIGASLGVTLPMFIFTYRLLKANKKENPATQKEADKDG